MKTFIPRFIPAVVFLVFTGMLSLLAGNISCTSTAFASGVKIAVINTSRIMKESKKAGIAQQALVKELETDKSLLSGKQNEAKRMKEELDKNDSKISPAEKKEKSEKLTQMINELQKLQNRFKEELNKKKRTAERDILTEVKAICAKLLKEKGYTIILEKNLIVALDESIDITDEIIKLYDSAK